MTNAAHFYSIGEAASICDISVKTLRYYDEIKLVCPIQRGESSGYRYYREDQLLTLFLVKRLRHLGFSIEDIRSILKEDNLETLEGHVLRRLREISGKIGELQNQYTEGKLFLERIRVGHDALQPQRMVYDEEHQMLGDNIHLEFIPERIVMLNEGTSQDYNNSDINVKRWFSLYQEIEKQGMTPSGPMIVTYLDGPLLQFTNATCNLRYSLPVDATQDQKGTGRFGGFWAVTSLHYGSATNMIDTHVRILKWINKNGYHLAGDISEEYLVSPLDTQNVEQQVTKVIIPIEKSLQ